MAKKKIKSLKFKKSSEEIESMPEDWIISEQKTLFDF
jgi:hypothetical protein